MYSNYLSINQNIVNKNTPTYTDIKRQVTISKQVTVKRQVIRLIKHMRANPHLKQRDENQNTLTDPNLAHKGDKLKKMESGKQRLPKETKEKQAKRGHNSPENLQDKWTGDKTTGEFHHLGKAHLSGSPFPLSQLLG